MVGSQKEAQLQLLTWPYYPLLDGNPNSVVTKNLDPVYSKFTNSIDTVKATKYGRPFCFSHHPTQDQFHTGFDFSLEMVKTASNPEAFQQSNIAASVILEGKNVVTLCQQNASCHE